MELTRRCETCNKVLKKASTTKCFKCRRVAGTRIAPEVYIYRRLCSLMLVLLELILLVAAGKSQSQILLKADLLRFRLNKGSRIDIDQLQEESKTS